MKLIMRKRKETERMKRSAGAPTNLHILQELGSIIVLSFTCEAFFVLSALFSSSNQDNSSSESSAKRAALACLHKIGENAHAQSIIYSWTMFLTNAHDQTIISRSYFQVN